jgi:hypothetical protein
MSALAVLAHAGAVLTSHAIALPLMRMIYIISGQTLE